MEDDACSESSPSLGNQHFRPVAPAERTFSAWDMGSLWFGLVVGIPGFYVAGSLVELGMSWWQGIVVVVFAHIIILFPLIFTGHAGVRYGIPFPVFARAAFGVRGACVPAVIRSLVACGWFGIETWAGGQAIFFILLPSSLRERISTPSSPGLVIPPLEFACFAVFWVAQLALMWKGMTSIRHLQTYSAPVLLLLVVWLFAWAWIRAGGLGSMLSLPARLTTSQFWQLFFPSLTANIGGWGALAVNIPDFTRYCQSQKDQILGQVWLPLFQGILAFVGLAIASASEVIFGRTISNPVELLGEAVAGSSPLVRLVVAVGVSLSIVTTNIPANVVAPASTLVSLSPTFSFQTAVLATALVGLLFQPWLIFGSSENFIKRWLVGCSAFLGPISGVVLADYYILRRRFLDVEAMYTTETPGPYYYTGGYNPAAMAALTAGIAPLVPGFLHELGILNHVHAAFEILYGVSWFFGFGAAGLVYLVLSRLASGGNDTFRSFPMHVQDRRTPSEAPLLVPTPTAAQMNK